MNPQNLFTSLTLLSVFLLSCKDSSKKFDPDAWYQQTKQAILKQSDKPSDSTHTEYYDDARPHKVKYFIHGLLTVEKWYRETGEQVAETHYSSDGEFELRTEICPSGKIGFEGIFYKKQAYGLSRWWECDEYKKQQEGIRFNNEKVGSWKKWDSNGEETISDYGNSKFIDSLATIKISE